MTSSGAQFNVNLTVNVYLTVNVNLTADDG